MGGDDRAVYIGDTAVAKLCLPGRLFHIYSHRGVYKISEVQKTFPSLNKIEIQGDIFEDHKGRSVYDALLQVTNVYFYFGRLILFVAGSSCKNGKV